MAITKRIYSKDSNNGRVETCFSGRVVRVEQRRELRNWGAPASPDASCYIDTDCTFALVWVGGTLSDVELGLVRWLQPSNRFVWLDCTNINADWAGYGLGATVDAEMGAGDPAMWADYAAWQQTETARKAKEAQEAEAKAAELVARKARDAAAKAKRTAKLEAQRAGVEAAMARTPAKGTEVTVGDFAGRVFWSGVKMYRGNWKGTVGLKDSRGDVRWVDSSHWA